MSKPTFTLSSPDIEEGHFMAKEHEFDGFGCTGTNQSPQLNWQHAPAGTKGFAVTVFDPDAPTCSGFWHWLVTDIPASAAVVSFMLNTMALGKATLTATYAR
jgi:Raf kinase inhibitor-like YbhB/YbcL family protein